MVYDSEIGVSRHPLKRVEYQHLIVIPFLRCRLVEIPPLKI